MLPRLLLANNNLQGLSLLTCSPGTKGQKFPSGHLLVSVSWCFRGLALAAPPLCLCHWRIKKTLCWAQTPTHLPAAPRPGEWTSKELRSHSPAQSVAYELAAAGFKEHLDIFLSTTGRKRDILSSSISRGATVTGPCSNRQSSSKLWFQDKKRSLTIRWKKSAFQLLWFLYNFVGL